MRGVERSACLKAAFRVSDGQGTLLFVWCGEECMGISGELLNLFVQVFQGVRA
jgi:hypothetical protein